MDKNMINIDELVRDRLSGAEEKERTGAWLQMRELLDKKMPVETPPVAFGWKRITGYIAGVILLAALSIGSYETLTTHGNRQAADNGTTPADGNNTVTTTSGNLAANDNANGIGGNPNSTSLNNYSQDNNTVRPANNNRNNNNNNNRNSGTNRNRTAATNSQNTGQSLAANTVHSTGNAITKSEHTAGPNNTTTADNNSVASTAANTVSGNHTNDASGNNSGTSNIGSSANNTVSGNTGHTTHSVAPRNPEATQRRHTGSTGTTTPAGTIAGTNTSTHTVVPAGSNNGRAHGNSSNDPIAGAAHSNIPDNKVAPYPALKKDTIEKIRLVQHYNRSSNAGRGLFRMDTIGVEQMIINRPADPVVSSAVSNTPSLSTARRQATAQKDPATFTMAPAASANAAKASAGLEADANSNLVPLANYRVASRKVTWDPQRFEEAVARFKYKLAQLKFYPGMVAGINASMFGPNSFGGFQLGLSSTVAFN